MLLSYQCISSCRSRIRLANVTRLMHIVQTVRIRPFCTVAVDFVAACGCENAGVQTTFLDPNHFSHKAISRLGPSPNYRKWMDCSAQSHRWSKVQKKRGFEMFQKSIKQNWPKKIRKNVWCILVLLFISFPWRSSVSLKASKTIGSFHARPSETGESCESPDVQVSGDVRSRSLNRPNSQGSLGPPIGGANSVRRLKVLIETQRLI